MQNRNEPSFVRTRTKLEEHQIKAFLLRVVYLFVHTRRNTTVRLLSVSDPPAQFYVFNNIGIANMIWRPSKKTGW